MRRYTKVIYICAILGLFGWIGTSMTGCEGLVGATGGAITMDHILTQAQEALAENIQRVNDKNTELRQLLETATTEEEKLRIEQAIASNERLKEQMTLAASVVPVVKAGTKTDFKDPASIVTLSMLALSVFANYLQDKANKKRVSENRGLTTENVGLRNGIGRYEGEAEPAVAGALHDTVKHELLKVGVALTAAPLQPTTVT